MLDQVSQGHDGPLVVVAHSNLLAFRVRVLLVRHENRHLCADLGELEGALIAYSS